MTSLWSAQIKAVVRLELKKTFFAKRGLWIYVLAILPLLPFVGTAILEVRTQNRNASLVQHGEKTLTYQDLLAIKTGMTREEVIGLLGKPPRSFERPERRPTGAGSVVKVQHERYEYSDGENALSLGLSDGRVDAVHVREAYNLGDNSIMFAGVFQFFFLRLVVFFGCLGIF